MADASATCRVWSSVPLRALAIPCLAIAVTALPVVARAQDSGSSAAARALVAAMVERKLDAFAIEDPGRPETFVAVRLYPGVQLLVSEAKSASPAYIRYQIDNRNYADAYSALATSGVAATKIFFQDMGCDGLSQDGEQVDVLYEQGDTRVLFDGKGKTSGLSKDRYARKFTDADARYTALLRSLLDGMRALPGVGSPTSHGTAGDVAGGR